MKKETSIPSAGGKCLLEAVSFNIALYAIWSFMLSVSEETTNHSPDTCYHDYRSVISSLRHYPRAIYWCMGIFTCLYSLMRLAESATPGADELYAQGLKHELGQCGLPKSMIKALRFYRVAAELQHPGALYKLGKTYCDRKICEQDLNKAKGYFQKAASLGHVEAMYLLGSIYCNRYAKDFAQGIQLIENSVDEQPSLAKLYPTVYPKLFDAFFYGRLMPQDLDKAEYYAKKTHELGNHSAERCFLGIACHYHLVVGHNIEKAKRVYAFLVKQFNNRFAQRVLDLLEKNTQAESHEVIYRKSIGAGSFGDVFECSFNGDSGYAIKKTKVLFADEKALMAWSNEVNVFEKLQRQIWSGFVVKFFTSWNDIRNGYIVLEQCDMNLAKYLYEKNETADKKQTFSIVNSMCEGLTFLHANNIIHRDIKLLNLLLRFDEQGMLQVKYCDFGASLDLDKSNVKSLQQFCNSLPEYVTMGYCHPESYSRSGVSKVISEQYPHVRVFEVAYKAFYDDYQYKKVGLTLRNKVDRRKALTTWLKKVDIFSLGICLFQVLNVCKIPGMTLDTILREALTCALNVVEKRASDPQSVKEAAVGFLHHHMQEETVKPSGCVMQ
jgi:TPR repeat protein